MKKFQLRMISIILSVLMVISSVDLNALATEINEENTEQIQLTDGQEEGIEELEEEPEKTEDNMEESNDKKGSENGAEDADDQKESEDTHKTESASTNDNKDSDSDSAHNNEEKNDETSGEEKDETKDDDSSNDIKDENKDDSETDKEANEETDIENEVDESVEETEQDVLEDEIIVEEVLDEKEEGFHYEKSIAGGYHLKIHAEDGAFPEDTTVEVATVDDKRSLHLESELNIAVEMGYYVEKMLALDITFMSDGEEIQPEDGKVDVSLELPASMQTMSAKSTSAFRVYHVGEDDEFTEMELNSDSVDTLSKESTSEDDKTTKDQDDIDTEEDSDADSSKEDTDEADKIETNDPEEDDKHTESEEKEEIEFETDSFSEYVFAVITKAERVEAVNGYIHYPGDDDVADIHDLPDDGSITTFGEDDLPAEYKTEKLPGLKNQSPYGSCWAHASMAAAEINRMKQGLPEQDYSELHLCYFSYNTVTDPLGGTEGDSNEVRESDFMNLGGNLNYSGNILAN